VYRGVRVQDDGERSWALAEDMLATIINAQTIFAFILAFIQVLLYSVEGGGSHRVTIVRSECGEAWLALPAFGPPRSWN